MQSTQIRRTIMATIGATAALASPLVMAHVGADGAPHLHDGSILSSLISGAAHPLTGLDHLAAMVSVGAWSALGQSNEGDDTSRVRTLLAAPAAFASALLLGAMAGMAGLSLPGVEPMVAASLLVLGLLLATRLHVRAGLGALLVAVFAVFHGLAHGSELGGHAAAALTGMLISTVGLHALGIALGLRLRSARHHQQRQLASWAGAGVALLGLSMLTPAIAASF
ncbi:hypothetical protein JY96_20145 [Aquabacterium sp. NJ1]|uniref:HupE/UreJ family protein n=1 Tax=Aquabacterium sp. NJ1 TaxID=1538295 RepID=UPI00052BD4D1|nr:HupE/UreJ family protein [Aquabacterium sp. NJ1]KGM42423.1 hypothetical protein JY96_20145 [Aquabacterium sp. NJ1]